MEVRTHPGTGEGWIENQRCCRTSFVNGPLVFARVARACLCECTM